MYSWMGFFYMAFLLYKNKSGFGMVYNFLFQKLKKLTKENEVCEKHIFLYRNVVMERPIIKAL
ncbi:TPA_asm: hypothetical protein GG841_11815 [Listeria monocytogenes]|nr:hypothetical protein [Listeria monocytogenes]